MNMSLHMKRCRLIMRANPQVARLLLLGAGGFVAPSWGYESAVHQQLTFLAAKQLSRCDQSSELQPLSALDTRYVVRVNTAQADRNVFGGCFAGTITTVMPRKAVLLWA